MVCDTEIAEIKAHLNDIIENGLTGTYSPENYSGPDFFTEDFGTLISEDATAGERGLALALLLPIVKPLRLLKPLDDVMSGGKTVGKGAGNGTRQVSDDVIEDGSHLVRGGKLKPNVKYRTGEYNYQYKTDGIGRLTDFNADDLKLTKRNNRLPHKSNTPEKEPGDHAGHLAADRFGGSPDLDNLVSQSSSVNLSKYKKLENQWAKAIEEGKDVSVNVKINYEGNSLRPSSFDIDYEIDGRMRFTSLEN